MKQPYVLTDGWEDYEYRMMTPAEAAEANEKADEATAGNLWWELA